VSIVRVKVQAIELRLVSSSNLG